MRYSLVYSPAGRDANLEGCGFMQDKTFRSGKEGFSVSLRTEHVAKMLELAKAARSDWVNIMGFPQEDRRQSKPPVQKPSESPMLDDEVPF